LRLKWQPPSLPQSPVHQHQPRSKKKKKNNREENKPNHNQNRKQQKIPPKKVMTKIVGKCGEIMHTLCRLKCTPKPHLHLSYTSPTPLPKPKVIIKGAAEHFRVIKKIAGNKTRKKSQRTAN